MKPLKRVFWFLFFVALGIFIARAVLLVVDTYSANAQTKIPQHRPESLNKFFNAMKTVYADDMKHSGQGPYKITQEFYRDSWPINGTYADVTNEEYARQVLERWWKRYYPKAWEKHDFEVLARTAYGGCWGEKDPSTFWFWDRVKRQIPFESGYDFR